MTPERSFTLAKESGLGLKRISNAAGLGFSALPNGCIFALEYTDGERGTMLNQVLGSPLGSGITRVLLRVGGAEPRMIEVAGPSAKAAFGGGGDRFLWKGEAAGVAHSLTLWLHPSQPLWLWRLTVENTSGREVPCDAVLVQDLGLGPRGFVMSNEAYASQYIDHTIPKHPRFGPVVMSRQNMEQDGRHPWVAHGCFERAESFATDAMQLFGPAYRDADEIALPFGENLPGERLQHEAACAIIQSRSVKLEPGGTAQWTFFGLYEPDHAGPTGESDLARAGAAEEAARAFLEVEVPLEAPVRSILQDAASLLCAAPEEDTRPRLHEEWHGGALLSYFVEDGPRNRHIVLRGKDRLVRRRHGSILRSGEDLLPSDGTLCATCWMHGVFAAQLAIGNTSFHKLFSVSRDGYNITRASGLRVLAEIGGQWRLLTLPSHFEMGLSDCLWDYRHAGGTITVHAAVSGEDAAMQWVIRCEGAPCRFLVFGNLVLGEHENAHASRVEVDCAAKRISFRPDPDWLWGQNYPHAVYHLVTSTPAAIDAIGGDELLFADGVARGTPFAAFRTHPANEVRFAIVGSMTDAAEAERLAAKYGTGVQPEDTLASANDFWSRITRDARLESRDSKVAPFNTLFPWLVHNALIHLAVPHGLEQYSGAAWGTRDVCQGAVEFLLALGHDGAAKEVLRWVFARQRRSDGDWPQWFFLEKAYSFIQAPNSHGDIIVWPLKALCDYIEATDDTAFLSEPVAWGRQDGSQPEASTIADHVRVLLDGVRARFIPGTSLPCYGEGDWNDTLQPADPSLRDSLVSSWTAALLFQQVSRYVDVLRRAGDGSEAVRAAGLANAIRADFHRYLIRDGIVAGYAHFNRDGEPPDLLLHPNDQKTGVSYSLIPMYAAMTSGLFTEEQLQHHLRLIREHLSFPDGVRLMDKPLPYHGGAERMFRRAESSPFFGREVGLMYIQAHLRYCEALAAFGKPDAFWAGLQQVNPVAVTDHVRNAAPRQRNCYYTSSDAAFRDRYEACAEWGRLKAAAIPSEGGWRTYSSGPGLFIDLLIRRAAGVRRLFSKEICAPLPSPGGESLVLKMNAAKYRKGRESPGNSAY